MEQDRQSPDPPRDEDERRARGLLDVLQRELAGEETIIAGRYVLGDRIGVGAHGSVHAALDRLTGERVAVKLLPPAVDLDLVRLRGEIAALRLLRLPGVVHLFDEGVDHGRPFLVMERVDGVPFPGALPEGETRWTWEALRGPTLALLDTLARVHAAGLVHRDLKPRNVLVTAAGRPMLLDFGLTVGRALAEDSASDTSALGTPAYAAPEQVRGESVDARADLYSLGVMLWEALAGRRPHEGPRVSGILRARLAGPVESIERAAPGVPHEVAEVVDALLEVERDARPRSAAEVAEGLRGENPTAELTLLEFVGREPVLARVLDAVERRLPVRVHGRPGSGRSRLLREASVLLEAGGHRRVAWCQPGTRPFESLVDLAAWLEPAEPSSLHQAVEMTQRALRRALDAGLVIFADDVDELDEWSRGILEGLDEGGVILSSHSAREGGRQENLELEPLGEADLAGLFDGSDRLLHVHEDAARELFGRTAGVPAAVHAELEGWVRAGLVERSGNRIAMTRVAVDRLRGGLHVLPALPAAPGPATEIEGDVDELLAWIHLAWPTTERERLARITGRTNWLLDAELERLVNAGAVRVLPDGRVRPLRASHHLTQAAWLEIASRRAHAELGSVLPAGSPGRLYHLVASEAHEAAAREALVVARAHAQDGRLGEAEVALSEGLRAARCVGGERAIVLEREILVDLLSVALGDVTPVACDRFLYATSRCARRDAELLHLEGLVHAALAVYESDGKKAMDAARRIRPFSDPRTERWRHVMLVLAVRFQPPSEQERVLREARAWAESTADDAALSSLDELEGLIRYRQGRFRDAAELQRRSAARRPRGAIRLSALLNAASALLEVPDLDGCESLALEASLLAAQLRHPLYEGRAQWLLRAARYRRGNSLEPDVDLVDAIERVGMRDQAAVAALHEAAIAWRAGHLQLATELAERSSRSWIGAGRTEGLAMTRALAAMASGVRLPEDEVLRLRDAALATRVPELGLQVLAMLVRAGMSVPDGARELLRSVSADRAGLDSSMRLDVLSLDEVGQILGPAPTS